MLKERDEVREKEGGKETRRKNDERREDEKRGERKVIVYVYRK